MIKFADDSLTVSLEGSKYMDEIAVVAYNHDPDFKRYVDKYIKANDLTFEEAMDHKIVHLYLDYIEHKDD